MRAAVLCLALAFLGGLSGCVYYNTFYHARAAARQAELLRSARSPGSSPGAQEIDLLDRVVEKCGRVLRLHPGSEWADDALLLLGTTLYYQGKYESARDRLSEFLTLYPKSELLPEAEYALAEVLLASGNPVSAEDMLAATAAAEPPTALSDDALALIGQARHARGEYEEAAEAYRALLERFPRSPRRAEVRFLAAENWVAMGRPEDAAAEYALVVRERGGRELAFDARIRLADLEITLGDAGHALTILEELERRAVGDAELDRVLLLRGRAYEATGDLDQAIATYEGIAASRERTEAAAEAFYRIGIVRRDRDRNLDAAAESFKKAKEQAPQSPVANLATTAVGDLEELKKQLAVFEPGSAADAADSLAGPPAGNDAAEGAAAPHAPPDSARAPAPSPPSAIESETAPSQGGAQASPLETAATPAGEAPVVRGEEELASARLRAAEIYLFKLGDPESALAQYRAIIERYPTSAPAPKAALAVGWISEHTLKDFAAAEPAYRRVIELFPGTEYAAAAQQAISRLSAGPGDEAPSATGTPTPAPAAGAVAPEDTTAPGDTTRPVALPAP
jgi:TolA-binding protein